MPQKQFRGQVWYNSDGIAAIRNDVTAAQWEKGVVDTLTTLFDVPPNKVSKAVLHAINNRDKLMVITPFPKSATPNADEGAADAAAGTPFGQTQAFCSDNPATPVDERGQPIPGAALGTGAGSQANVRFTAQDHPVVSEKPGATADEILFHEMVHGVRDMRGQGRCSAVANPAILPKRHHQDYDNFEEFAAILITNIYHSECNRPQIRKDHQNFDPLLYPLTNARNFYIVWEKVIDKLCGEMMNLSIHIANLRGIDWNPLQFSVKSRLHLDRIEELDQYEAVLNQYGW